MSTRLTQEEIDEASFDPDLGLELREDFIRALKRSQESSGPYTPLSEILGK